MKPDEEAMLIALIMKRYGYDDEPTLKSKDARLLLNHFDDYVMDVGGHVNDS